MIVQVLHRRNGSLLHLRHWSRLRSHDLLELPMGQRFRRPHLPWWAFLLLYRESSSNLWAISELVTFVAFLQRNWENVLREYQATKINCRNDLHAVLAVAEVPSTPPHLHQSLDQGLSQTVYGSPEKSNSQNGNVLLCAVFVPTAVAQNSELTDKWVIYGFTNQRK